MVEGRCVECAGGGSEGSTNLFYEGEECSAVEGKCCSATTVGIFGVRHSVELGAVIVVTVHGDE